MPDKPKTLRQEEPVWGGVLAPDHTVNIEVPDIGTWIRLLNGMQAEPILTQIHRFFAQRDAEGWDCEAVRRFQMDFLQGIFYNIKQNGQLAHEYYSGPMFAQLYLHGSNSLKDLDTWAAWLVNGYLEVVRGQLQDKNAVERAMEYINQEFTTLIHVTAAEIAAHAGVSRRHLTRLFKAETGQTMTAYLNDLRLERGAQLLRKTRLPIGEVASRSGFNDTGYFIRLFKRKYGETPTQCRSRLPEAGALPAPLKP